MKHKTWFNLSALLILMCITIYGRAQDTSRIQKVLIRDVQVDFQAGYIRNEHGPLNNVLHANGWAPLSKGLLTYGIAPKLFTGRFMVGFGVQAYFSSEVNKTDNLETNLSGYLTGFYGGYALINKDKLKVYPYVGLNSSFSRLQLSDTSPFQNSDEAWTGSRRGGLMTFNSYALDIGIRAEKIFNIKNKTWDCPQNAKYIAVSFNAGYYVNLNAASNARFNGQKISDAPSFNMNGFYGTVNFSPGTRIRKLKWE